MKPVQIRHRLGQPFSRWAREQGHNPNTVRVTIREWHDKTTNSYGHLPSHTAASILLDLSRDVGADVSPAVTAMKQAATAIAA